MTTAAGAAGALPWLWNRPAFAQENVVNVLAFGGYEEPGMLDAFTAETGIEAAARGVQMVVANVRDKFPQATVIAAKILPAHAPDHRFYEDIKKSNLALDALKIDRDPKVQVLDLWANFTNADGKLKAGLFTPDNIHLSLAGYIVYAERLKPLLDRLLAKN